MPDSKWFNLFVDHKTQWRRAKDKLGNQVIQYVVTKQQRLAIMDEMHTNLLSGHLMLDKTLIKTRNRFFWQFMRIQIQDFIASCEPCQLATHPHRIPKAKLTPIQTKVKRSLELVTTDFRGSTKTKQSREHQHCRHM
jgi:hypothetical protein